MHKYNGEPFERVITDITEPFPDTEKRNQHLLIAMDYTTWKEVNIIPNKQALTVMDTLMTDCSCHFRVQES
jgi:hypothetical protein